MPSWKKIIVSGSNPELNNITASGNISGSTTSTGSFGALQINGSPLISGDSDGIGIGVSNPTAKIDIADTHGTIKIGTQANNNPEIRLTGTGVYGANIILDGANSGHGAVSVKIEDFFLGQQYGAGGDFHIDTTLGGDMFCLTSDGDLGLGTNIPSASLHVDGNILVNTHVTASGNISGSSTSTGSFGTLRVGPISGYGAASGIAFGDGDTAIYEQSDDVLNVKIGTQTKWQFNGDNILSPGTNKAQISPDNGVTSPTFIPGRSHTDTGYGSNGGKMLSLIAGGASILQVSSSGTISGSSTSTASFGRIEATTISASRVDVDAGTLAIGGTELGKTVADNIKNLDKFSKK